MAVNADNVKLGVCSISFGGTDMGATKGGVELTVETTTHEVTVDQTGETPINQYIIGRKVTAKVPLAETTLDNLVKNMGRRSSGDGRCHPTLKRVDVPMGVGTGLLDIAHSLVLHPIGLDRADKSEDVTLYLAATSGVMTFAYKVDEERVFIVEFKAYPDPDHNNDLYGLGDPASESA
ncbi:hypothetical protein [Castellaniella sp. UC4442_H9]